MHSLPVGLPRKALPWPQQRVQYVGASGCSAKRTHILTQTGACGNVSAGF